MTQPKIVFLGTAGDSIVAGKQLLASGGIAVLVDDNQFILDPGPGSITKSKQYGVNVRDSTGVIVCNSNLLNCNDANAVVDAMTLGGIDKFGVLLANKSSLIGSGGARPYITERHKSFAERAILLEPGKRVGINEIEISATKTKGDDETGIGIRMLTSQFRLGYTGDTGYNTEIAEQYKGVDLLIVKMPLCADQKEQHRLNTDDAIKLISHVKPKLAILTHFGIKVLKEDILEETRKVQRSTKIQTIAARDGMVINPISYAVNLRQKTLNFY